MSTVVTNLGFAATGQSIWNAPGLSALPDLTISTKDLMVWDPGESRLNIDIGGAFAGFSGTIYADVAFGLVAEASLGSLGTFDASLDLTVNVDRPAVTGRVGPAESLVPAMIFDFSDYSIGATTLSSQPISGPSAKLSTVIQVQAGIRDIEWNLGFFGGSFDDIRLIDVRDGGFGIFALTPNLPEFEFKLGEFFSLNGRLPQGVPTKGSDYGSLTVKGEDQYDALSLTDKRKSEFLTVSADLDKMLTELISKAPFPPAAAAAKALEQTVFAEVNLDLADFAAFPRDAFSLRAKVVDIEARVAARVTQSTSIDFGAGEDAPPVKISLRSDNGTPDDASDDVLGEGMLGERISLATPTFPGEGFVNVTADYDLERATFGQTAGIGLAGALSVEVLKASTKGAIGSALGLNIGPLLSVELPIFDVGLGDAFANSFDVTDFDAQRREYKVLYTTFPLPEGLDPDGENAVEQVLALGELRHANKAAAAERFGEIVGGKTLLTKETLVYSPSTNPDFPDEMIAGVVAPNATNSYHLHTFAEARTVISLQQGLPDATRNVVGIDGDARTAGGASLFEAIYPQFRYPSQFARPVLTAETSLSDFRRALGDDFGPNGALLPSLEDLSPLAVLNAGENRIEGFTLRGRQFVYVAEVAGSPATRWATLFNSVDIVGTAGDDVLAYIGDEATFFDGLGQGARGDTFLADFAASHPDDAIRWDLRASKGGDAVSLDLTRRVWTSDEAAAPFLANFTEAPDARAARTLDGSAYLIEGQPAGGLVEWTYDGPAGTYTLRFRALATGATEYRLSVDGVEAGRFEADPDDRDEYVAYTVEEVALTPGAALSLDVYGAVTETRVDVLTVGLPHEVTLRGIENFAVETSFYDDYLVAGFGRDVILMGGGQDELVAIADRHAELFDLGEGNDYARVEIGDAVSLGLSVDTVDTIIGGRDDDEVTVQNVSASSGARVSMRLFVPFQPALTLDGGAGSSLDVLQALGDGAAQAVGLYRSGGVPRSFYGRRNDPGSAFEAIYMDVYTQAGPKVGVRLGATVERNGFIGSDTAGDLALFSGGRIYDGGEGAGDAFAANFELFEVELAQSDGVYLTGDPGYGVGLGRPGPAGGAVFGESFITGFERFAVTGTSFDDVLIGGAEDDRFAGAGGDDLIAGRGGANLLFGGAGSDRFLVEAVGWSLVDGGTDPGEGADVERGVTDSVVVRPGAGFDGALHGALRHAVADGTAEAPSGLVAFDAGAAGARLDDLLAAGDAPVRAIFWGADADAPVGGVRMTGIESSNVVGTDGFDDLLVYDGGASYLAGERPGDADVFVADFSEQRTGVTLVIEDDPEDGVGAVRLRNGVQLEGIDRAHVTFGEGNDVARGGGLADVLRGGGGSDALSGGAGNDGLFGGDGDDVVYWEGGSGFDRADGGAGERDRLIVSLQGEDGAAFGEGGAGYALYDAAPQLDRFAVRYEGVLNVETAGGHTFFLGSDDGSELWLDGVRVIDNDALQAFTTRQVTLELGVGPVPIEVRYFENAGGQGLRLEYLTPGATERRLVDADVVTAAPGPWAAMGAPTGAIAAGEVAGWSASIHESLVPIAALDGLFDGRTPDAVELAAQIDHPASLQARFYEGGRLAAAGEGSSPASTPVYVDASSSSSDLSAAVRSFGEAARADLFAGGGMVGYSGFEAVEIAGSDAFDDLVIFDGGVFYAGGEREGDADVFGADLSDETADLIFEAPRAEDEREEGASGFFDIGTGALVGGFERYVLRLGEGDDRATGGALGDSIDGGGGDDVLAGGLGDDVVNGGAGADVIFFSGGRDEVRGGTGEDVLELGRLAGGYAFVRVMTAGFDERTFTRAQMDGTDGLRAAAGALLTQFLPDAFRTETGDGASSVIFEEVERLVFTGGGADDLLVSGAMGGVLSGDGGDDVLIGRGGDDRMLGGGGADRYVLSAGFGRDVIAGEFDRDTQVHFLGLDRADVSFAADGRHLVLSAGDDVLTLVDYYRDGQAGLEFLFAFDDAGPERIAPPGGAASGGASAGATLIGTDGRDVLERMSDGRDEVYALGGADVILGSPGSDLLDGGLGADAVFYFLSDAGVTVDLAAGLGRGGDADGDVFVSIEDVFGSEHDDALSGDARANALSGGGGDDALRGAGGDDVLEGGDGADELHGEAGEDRLFGGSSGDALFGGEDDDLLDGGDGDDLLEGGGGDDGVIGGDGDDVARLGAGEDTYVYETGPDALLGGRDDVDGGADRDTLDFSRFEAAVRVDLLRGEARTSDLAVVVGAGARALVDFASVERAVGSAFDDVLLGGGLSIDDFAGGAGDDFLRGGAGGDGAATGERLFGGGGFDTVDYAGESGGGAVDIDLSRELDEDGLGVDDGIFGNARDAAGDRDWLDGVEAILGTAGDDVVRGSDADELLAGGDGFDRFEGGGGVDTIDYSREGGTLGVEVDLSVLFGEAAIALDTFGKNDALISVERVLGTARADSLTGGGGDETLTGGAGDDALDGGAGGGDVVDYGAEDGGLGVVVDLAAGTARDSFGDVDALAGFEAVIGTAQADEITGAGAQTAFGGDGDDVLSDLAAADGGAGRDRLQAGGRGSRLTGGDGDDTAVGGAGDDVYVYVASAPGSGGTDLFQGGGEEASDAVDFGLFDGGAVEVDLASGRAALRDGDAALVIFDEVERAVGTGGDDVLRGLEGAGSTLEGGGGDDLLIGRAGDDVLDGGAGVDVVDYSAEGGAFGVTADLGASGANAVDSGGGADTLRRIEHVIGTALDDSLTGDDGDNVFAGLGGVDFFDGGAGFDVLDFSGDAGPQGATVRLGFDTLQEAPLDDFAASFAGVLSVRAAGGYVFDLTSDDGSALYIDGRRVIDNDGLHAARTLSATVALDAGDHDVEVRYFERSGAQGVTLSYAGEDTADLKVVAGRSAAELVAGAPLGPFTAEVFDIAGAPASVFDIDFDAPPISTRTVELIDFPNNDEPYFEGGPRDGFALRLTSAFEVAAGGDYAFRMASDDGSVLLIDGEVVVDNDGLHAFAQKEGSVTLFPGTHAFEVLHYEATQFQGLGMEYRGPDTAGLWLTAGEDPGAFPFGPAMDGFDAAYFALPPGVASLSQVDFDAAPLHRERIEALDFETSAARGFFAPQLRGNVVGTFGEVETALGIEGLIGSARDDAFHGSAADEIFAGGDGADVIDGGDGVDALDFSAETGGGAVQVRFDRDGANVIDTFGRRDAVRQVENAVGGDGDDLLVGGAGANVLDGGAGDDVLAGGDGDDVLIGGTGRDAADYRLDPGAGGVIVDLRAAERNAVDRSGGRDTLNGIEIIFGSGLGDEITGDAQANDLHGGDGDDGLRGWDGADALFGGKGDDVLDGGAGRDTLEGGDGEDTLEGGRGEDRLLGGVRADALFGGDGADILIGGAGDDRLTGGAGSDVFLHAAGDGRDVIADMGAGLDRLRFEGLDYAALEAAIAGAGAQGSTLDFGAAGAVALEGVRVADLAMSDFQLRRVGGDEADDFEGSVIADFLEGLEGADRLLGRDGDDDLRGGGGADEIRGGAGRDRIFGEDGDDSLWGDGDADTLWGGEGDDSLTATAGDDVLTGDGGADVFRATPGAATVTITDFTDGEDVLDLRAFDAAAVAEAIVTARAGSVILDIDGVVVTLQGIDLARFSADDVMIGQAPAIVGDLATTVSEASPFASGAVFVEIGDIAPGAGFAPRLIAGDIGDLALEAEGGWTFRPDRAALAPLDNGETAVERFVFAALDGTPGEVEITVTGLNRAPTLAPFAVLSLGEDAAEQRLDLRAGAADPDFGDGPETLAYVVDGPAGAGVFGVEDGVLRFDPADAFQDLDDGEERVVRLTVAATDAGGASAQAELQVRVQGADDDPVAGRDAGPGFATTEDAALVTPSLLANDSDADAGDVLRIIGFAGAPPVFGATVVLPSGARAVLRDDFTLSYDPAGAFEALGRGDAAVDVIPYSVGDGDGAGVRGQVEIRIAGVDEATVTGTKGVDDLRGDGGANTLIGGGGNDEARGLGGRDVLNLGGGGDLGRGGGGADRLLGGGGRDRLFGDGGNDALFGGGGRDALFGGGGRDALFGGGGRDALFGGGGRDALFGGGGRDRLEGGRGNDRLDGGGGKDLFVFGRGDGKGDRIKDFQDGRDLIEIGSGARGFRALEISDRGDDAVVRFANVKIRVEGADADQLDAADFVFA